jgi:hypothetical protein
MSRFAGLFTPQSTLTQTSTTPVIIPNTSNEFITTNSSVNRPIVHNTYPITQRIIERVITTTTPATSGVSEAELKTKLDEVYRTFALVMSGFGEPNHTTVTTITNTVSGSYLPLSGGTLTGTLALTGATTTAVNGIDIASGCFSINGVCLTAGTGSSATGYPFPLAGNATSTLTQFNGGLTAYASSTIGNGFAGLTVNGNATTTGNAYFARNVGIGTTTPQAVLDVTGQALFNIPSTLPATLQNTWIAGVIGNGNIAQNGGFTQVNFAPTESGNYAGSQLQYGYLDTNNNYHELWSIGGEINDTSDQTTRDFYISQAQNGSQLTIFANKDVAIGGDTQGLGGEGSTLIAKGNGTVGIGTSSPFALASIHALNGSTNTTLFAIASSTQTATMTLFSVSNTGAASTTQLYGAGLASCNGASNALTWNNGLFGCNSITSGSTFPFTPTTAFGSVANATSTLIGFINGIYATASSTIGNGTQQGGLTIWGGATTTGSAYIAGNLTVGPGENALNSLLQGYLTPAQLLVTNASNFTGLGIESQNSNGTGLGLYSVQRSTASAGSAVAIEGDAYAAGANSNAYGVWATAQNDGAAVSSLVGIRSGVSVDTSGGASAAEAVGLDISSIFGATNNYAIRTGLGTVSFGDIVGVGTTTPWAQLSLNPNGIGTRPAFAIGSSTRTLFSISNTGAASTTQLFGANLASCSGSNALTWSSGLFGCTNVGAAAFPFTPTTAELRQNNLDAGSTPTDLGP